MATIATDIPASLELSPDDVSSFEAFGFLRLGQFLRRDFEEVRAGFESAITTRDVGVLHCDEFYETSRTGWNRSPRQIPASLYGSV